MNIDYIYDSCVEVVINAGKNLLEAKNNSYKILRKSEFELVTELDIKIQGYIISELGKVHKVEVITEEVRKPQASNFAECFILDPIDGTHNLIAGFHIYGISLAYVLNKEVIFGIAYFPELELLYCALKGKGAYKNNCRIFVSDNNTLKKSMVSYDNHFPKKPDINGYFKKLNNKIFTIRLTGSAVFDGCQVAEGVFDARILNETKLCDVAANIIIVQEAGGHISNFIGNNIHLDKIRDIIISNKLIHKQIIRVLQ